MSGSDMYHGRKIYKVHKKNCSNYSKLFMTGSAFLYGRQAHKIYVYIKSVRTLLLNHIHFLYKTMIKTDTLLTAQPSSLLNSTCPH